MMSFKLRVVVMFLMLSAFSHLLAQVHPKEALGRKIFDSFRTQNFKSLYDSSIFSLTEENFRFLLKNIRNQSLRNDLIRVHSQPFRKTQPPRRIGGRLPFNIIGETNGDIFPVFLLNGFVRNLCFQ